MSRKNELKQLSEVYEAVILNELGGSTPGDGLSTVPAPQHPEVIAIKKTEDELEPHNDQEHTEPEAEGDMVRGELYKIHKDAKELYNIIKSCSDIEPWVFSKITIAASYINGVKNYLEYDKFKKEGEFDLDRADHHNNMVMKVRDMLQGESKEVLEGVIRQAIFNLEALQTIEETKK
jgi:hypothetical protein